MSKALKEAIQANDPAAVEKALKGVKDLNRKLPGASAPLMYACQVGADKVLETLIKAGAVAEKKNVTALETPFWAAAEHGQFAAMKRLLELKQVSKNTLTVSIEMACLEAKAGAVEFLLKETKPPITIELLRLAVANAKDGGILKLLLKSGGSATFRFNRSGEAEAMTPLHEFADASPEVIRILVEHGADVNVRDGFLRTPLMILAASFEWEAGAKKMEALNLFLKLGADATLTDTFGNDAIDYCLFEFLGNELRSPPQNLLAVLRKAGAKGSPATIDLFEAIRKRDRKKIEAALKDKADVNRFRPPPTHGTPLGWAVSEDPESERIVELLLKAGADPNRSMNGHTALMAAARAGNMAVVKKLVDAGAKVNAVYRSGEYIENAYTAAENHEEVRQFLKSIGAGNPKYEENEELKAGVASWNDFSETLVKSDVKKTADGLAKFIGGKVTLNVYGQTFNLSAQAYVVIRPKGMQWSNVFRVAPPPNRFDDVKKNASFAAALAKACNAPALAIDYSDTSDAASVVRVDANGKKTEDQGWDFESLQELVDALGEEAPAWAKKKLAETDEEEPSSAERLEALAKKEKFVVAAFGFYSGDKAKLDIEVTGYGADAFDGVAFVAA